MNELQKRILDLSYKYKLSHIGSCLTSVDTIDGIYKVKGKHDPFVLSNGHAGLALYVVLEKYRYGNAEAYVSRYGTHPDRNMNEGLFVSTGSLGQGLPIAVGMAMADKSKTVYCMMSDGECAEGSVWEALRIAGEQRLENLRIAVIANGYSAYQALDVDLLEQRLNLFYPCVVIRKNLFNLPDWAQGLQAHYHVMSESDYKAALEVSL